MTDIIRVGPASASGAAKTFAEYIDMLRTRPYCAGVWDCANVGPDGSLMDVSGQGLHFTQEVSGSGDPDTDCLEFTDNVIDPTTPAIPGISAHGDVMFVRADEAGLDITGDEIYIRNNPNTSKGMTWVLWYKDGIAGTSDQLDFISKAVTDEDSFPIPADSSFVFGGSWDDHSELTFQVYDGSTSYTVLTDLGGPNFYDSVWHFVAFRFTAGVDIEIYFDGTWFSLGSAPSTINDSDARLCIMGLSWDGGTFSTLIGYQGKMTAIARYRGALSNDVIDELYAYSRDLFGV